MELQTDRAEQHSILNSSNAPTILCRWWVPACLTAWIIFVVYEIGIGFDQLYSRHPICPYSDREYSPLYWLVNYVVLGAFLLTWIMLLMKIFQMKPGPTRVPLLTAFHIVSIGTIATILALVWNWGGVCIDALGVASPAAIWGEWIATAPLLVLITVTIVDKPELSKTDWFLMITFSFCLVFAWLIIVNESYGWGVFWFLVSASMYLPMLYLPFYLTRNSFISPEGLNNEYTSAPIDEDNAALEDITDAYLYMKRYYLAMLLTIILPMYTFSYILAWAGVIDGASIIAIYQVLSGTTKGLFAALCMDAHIDALMEAERAVERRANVARRAFLKYIFHEVRTPLNSLTMGIEILQMSENLEEEDMESLIMMKGASEFMSDTLNDVLSMQKIEEGKLELDLSPFSIKDAINKVFLSLRGASSTKKITLSMQVPDVVPAKVIGDRYRIEHVISNLVSNAIKFTPDGRNVRVAVTSGPIKTTPTAMNNNRRTVDVTISILDEGIGISPENQKKLFNNFVQIRPGALQQGQGSGLGLSLCKQIVTLHGGTIGVHSAEGQGSTFSFTIPFSVYEDLSIKAILPVLSTTPVRTHCEIRGKDGIGKEEKMIETSSQSPTDSPAHPPSRTEPLSLRKMPMKQRSRSALEEDVSGDEKFIMTDGSLEVLVVDDVESNRKMMMMLLRKNGVQAVHTVIHSDDALEIIRKNMEAFKLIFMENLISMHVVEAMKTLRREGYRHIIVGVTGNVLEDDIQEYLEAGADFIIGKPLKMPQLEMILRHVKDNGSISQPGMRLMEQQPNKLEWTPWP